MKIAIIHISDMHFKSRQDIGFKRLQKLVNTINFSKALDEKLIFAVTGDIANTGSSAEYKVAQDFFRPLFSEAGVDATEPGVVNFIPGNHDCSFHDLGDLRPRLLTEIEEQLNSIDGRGETVKTLLQVQSDFFGFQENITSQPIPMDSQLYQVKKYPLGL